MFLPERLRTTSFRIAALYAGFFLLSVLVILGITYLTATREMREALRDSIEADEATLRTAYEKAGASGLRKQFDDLALTASEDRFYLLEDKGGAAGNVPPSLWDEGWTSRAASGAEVAQSQDLRTASSNTDEGDVTFLMLGLQIGPEKIGIGRNYGAIDETQGIIIAASIWGGLATTLLALVGGYLVSAGPTRRVDAIAAATRRIVEGQLDLRLPVTARGDELDRLSTDINAMLAQIESLLSSLRQVTTDIAHDMRTPLARLRQRLDSVRRTPRERQDYEIAIDEAVGEADAAIETFNALLGIAHIESGAVRQRFRPIGLGALVGQLFEIYRDVAADAGHELHSAVESDAIISGDGELLTQALANLIENAINHVPAKGSIALGLRAEKGRAVLEVGDDGPGVPPAERQTIFRRLYRLDRSRSTPGHGLGLALVAAIAELHGGTVEALDNRPGLLIRMSFPIGPSPGGTASALP